jgi:hypothetical protein
MISEAIIQALLHDMYGIQMIPAIIKSQEKGRKRFRCSLFQFSSTFEKAFKAKHYPLRLMISLSRK